MSGRCCQSQWITPTWQQSPLLNRSMMRPTPMIITGPLRLPSVTSWSSSQPRRALIATTRSARGQQEGPARGLVLARSGTTYFCHKTPPKSDTQLLMSFRRFFPHLSSLYPAISEQTSDTLSCPLPLHYFFLQKRLLHPKSSPLTGYHRYQLFTLTVCNPNCPTNSLSTKGRTDGRHIFGEHAAISRLPIIWPAKSIASHKMTARCGLP